MGIEYKSRLDEMKSDRYKIKRVQYRNRYFINFMVPRYIKELRGDKFWSQIKGGYGEIGRRCGLDWIEP
jgi:hypothetical protein